LVLWKCRALVHPEKHLPVSGVPGIAHKKQWNKLGAAIMLRIRGLLIGAWIWLARNASEAQEGRGAISQGIARNQIGNVPPVFRRYQGDQAEGNVHAEEMRALIRVLLSVKKGAFTTRINATPTPTRKPLTKRVEAGEKESGLPLQGQSAHSIQIRIAFPLKRSTQTPPEYCQTRAQRPYEKNGTDKSAP